MSCALVVVTDGRMDYLARTMESATQNLRWPFTDRLILNDSGSRIYGRHLAEQYPDFRVISHEPRAGLAKAVQRAWENVDADFIFHLEEDFTLDEPVNVAGMMQVLRDRPRMAQIVLKRQPWSAEEIRAGGIIELHPEDYKDVEVHGIPLAIHKRIFSLNPCLIPADVKEIGWPLGNEAEFTEQLIRMGYFFAFYGHKKDTPRVTHIGIDRSPGWAA